MSDSTAVNSAQSQFRRGPLLTVVGIGLVVALAVFVVVNQRGVVAPNHLELALAAQKRGDRAAAIAALQAHLKTVPDSTSARLRLASLLRESQPEEALVILSAIPDSDSQRTAVLQETAIIHLLAGRHEEAASALQAIIALEPENFGAQLSLAELYFNSRNPRNALPPALAAARLAPNRAQSFVLIAEIYDELQNYEEMIEPLQTALAIDPKLYAAHLNLAYAHHRIGQLTDAAEHAQWCLKENPREVSALRILASVARNEGRFEEAETRVAKALQIQPDDVDCRILEADLLLYQRQPRAAYERLKELYEAQQTTVRFLGALARAAAAAGERDEARKLYQSVEELVQQSRAKQP